MLSRLLTVTALVGLTSAPAFAGALHDGAWASTRTTLTYKVVHKFHEVEGSSTAAEARAAVADGKLQVQVRVPAGSFASGNGNRDSNVKAVVEAADFPWVTLKGVAPVCALETTCVVQLQAVVDFHGVQKPYLVPVTLTALPNGHVEAKFHLDLVLTEHKITLPSLMFIPIDDHLAVDGTIEMEHRA